MKTRCEILIHYSNRLTVYQIIDMTNLRTIDLNLLVVLDALLDEAHVSHAADRLGLSQPAASAALQRCRHLFRDELLERGRGTMYLTPCAEALRAPLKSLLADVIDLIDPPEIPLAELRQTLRLTTSDYPALVILGPLLQELQTTAPGIDIVIQPWHGAEAAQAALIDGSSDLAISLFPRDHEELRRQLLLDETYRVAMRRGHPAAENFNLDAWLAYPHIIVSGRGDVRSPLDADLATRGLTRRVGLVVPTFQMVPELLEQSEMIAMLPSHCFPASAD
jgi:DNA-binding transcriptional LysR family regulator